MPLVQEIMVDVKHNCTDLRGGGYVCHCNDGFAISDIDKKSCKGMVNVECPPIRIFTKTNLLACDDVSESVKRNN